MSVKRLRVLYHISDAVILQYFSKNYAVILVTQAAGLAFIVSWLLWLREDRLMDRPKERVNESFKKYNLCYNNAVALL